MGRSIRFSVGLLCLALVVSGCSIWPFETGSPAEAGEGMRWMTTEQCAALVLDGDSAQPLQPVPLQGWPEVDDGDLGIVVARVMTDGEVGEDPDEDPGDAQFVTIRDWYEDIVLHAPVHPTAGLDGGDVRLRFGQIDDDEQRWCDQIHPLTIDALAEADEGQGVEEQLAAASELLEVILEGHDTTGADLAHADRDALAPELVPLYALAVVLHGDDGLTDAVAGFTAEERDDADRMSAQLQRAIAEADPTDGIGALVYREAGDDLDATEGLGDGLDDPVEAPDRPDAPPAEGSPDDRDGEAATSYLDVVAGGAAVGPQTIKRSATGGRASDRPQAPGSGGPMLVNNGGCEVTDFDGLTRMLGRQISGETMAGGNTGRALEAAGDIFGAPIIGRVGLPTVLLAWATKFAAGYLEGMMPSTWLGTDFDTRPGELWEDDVDGGYVESISMTFESKGWDAGEGLAELAMIVASQVSAKALERYLRKPRLGDSNVIRSWGGPIYDSLESAELAAVKAELVAEVLTWLVGLNIDLVVEATSITSGILVYEPRCWEARTERPDLDDSLRLHYLGAIERGTEREHYVARTLGEGQIEARWELAVGSEVLGVGLSRGVRDARATFGASADVAVRSLAVTWTPSRKQVAPGDLVALNILVTNAHDGRVRITDSLGQTDQVIDASDGGLIFFQVPDDWDEAAPIAITAVSLSDRGMRDPSHPGYRGPIESTAMLSPEGEDQLYLDPNVTCLETSEVIELRALDDGLAGAEVAVRWEVDRGTISSNGRFTAPSEPGEVTVTATALDDPDLEASWTLAVGGCDQCSYDLSIEGLLGPESRSATSGDEWYFEGIYLDGVDWETGAFESIGLGLAGGAGQAYFANADGQPSTAPSRSMELRGGLHDVYTIFEGDFFPDERRDEYDEMLAGRDGPAVVEGWSVPQLSGQFESRLVTVPEVRTPSIAAPESPMLLMSGRITGQVLVGRRLTTTLDGMPYAATTRLAGEPILGTLTLTFDAAFRPPFDDTFNPDHELWESRDLTQEQQEEPISLRTYDVTATTAWCGGVHGESHDRFFDGDIRGGLPDLGR